MLSEPERLAYLEALGITQYCAVAAIPNGLQLPEVVFESTVERATDTPAFDPLKLLAADAASDSSSAKQDDPTPPTAASSEATDDIVTLDLGRLNAGLQAETSKASTQQSANTLRFALYVMSTPKLRLVVELGVADAPNLSAKETRFIADLLLALGLPQDPSQYEAKLFRWPLVNNPRIAADNQAALEALISFFAADATANKTLFLSGAIPRLLPEAELGLMATLPNLTNRIMCTHSVSAMVEDWRLKAEAWRHLQVLLND